MARYLDVPVNPEHSNVALLRTAYDSWAAGSADSFVEACDEDVVWHIPGNNRLTGDHVGLEAVRGLFAELAAKTDGAFCMTYEDVLATESHALVATASSANVGGETLSYRVFDVFRLDGGRIKEIWTFTFPQESSDRVWSRQ
jgi:ketosteroid isomerase-like protein